MLCSRWPRSPSHGKCSKRFCGSSRSCGRSHHQRQRETFDVMTFKSNRQKECVQMPGKMPRSDRRPSVRVIRGAVSGQHLASVLQEGRENANIDAGLGFIWRISANTTVPELACLLAEHGIQLQQAERTSRCVC